jgi:multiple sugar transport system ATP-binding protein
MTAVTLHEVTKTYGEASVIEGLNLEVRPGEFMVLVGPSGCGKSTVLRMIAGLEEVTAGRVSIGDRIVNDVAPRDRDIAMVFQNYALYPHMTVRENLEFGLQMRRTDPGETRRRVAEAAAALGLSELFDRRPAQLSGGQRQRVAVGRALVRKPAVFLFDEPLSNLDAKLRVQMRAEIKDLQRRLGTTTVYVTHDQVEAMTLGSRIAVMRDGRIQQIGAPLEIYGRPANLFVASFIGSPPMNLLEARVEPGGAASLRDGRRVPLPSPDGLEPGRAVILGIRPENVFEVPGRTPSATLPLDVEFVELLGDEVIVHGRIGDDRLLCKLGPDRVPAAGGRIDIGLDVPKMHVFDRATERRLIA